MDKPVDNTQEVPVIDQRMLAAVDRNIDCLDLTEWLEQYTKAIDDEPNPGQRRGRQSSG